MGEKLRQVLHVKGLLATSDLRISNEAAYAPFRVSYGQNIKVLNNALNPPTASVRRQAKPEAPNVYPLMTTEIVSDIAILDNALYPLVGVRARLSSEVRLRLTTLVDVSV